MAPSSGLQASARVQGRPWAPPPDPPEASDGSLALNSRRSRIRPCAPPRRPSRVLAHPRRAPVAADLPQLPSLAPILAVQFIGTLSFSIALPFRVLPARDFGGAPWTYGLVVASYSAAQLLGAPILGRWSDRAGRSRVLLVSQAGTLAAWILFFVALQLPLHAVGALAGASLTAPLLLVFTACLLDGLAGGNISVANAFVADATRHDPRAQSKTFGQISMAASLGFTLGPAIAGVLEALAEGYAAPVVAAIAISAVGVLLCLRIEDPDGRCPEGPPQPTIVSRVLGQQQRRCDRPTPAPSRGALRRPLIVGLLAATFVQFLGFNLYYSAFPLHATGTLEWSAGRMGLFFSAMSGAMLLAQGPVLTFLSARLDPRRTFSLGVASLVGAFCVFALPGTWTPFAAGLLFALGNGIAWSTFLTRTADAAGDAEQGAIQGAAASAGALASIAGSRAAVWPIPGWARGCSSSAPRSSQGSYWSGAGCSRPRKSLPEDCASC